MWRANGGFFCLSILPLFFFLVSTPAVSLARFLRMSRLPIAPSDPFASGSRNNVPFQTYSASGMNVNYNLYPELSSRNGDDFLTDQTTSSEPNDRFHKDDTPVMEPDGWMSPVEPPFQEDAKSVHTEPATSHTPKIRKPSHLAATQIPTQATDHVSPQEPTDHAAPEEHPGLEPATNLAISEELPDSETSGPDASREPSITIPTGHASPEEPTIMKPADPAAAPKESSSKTLMTHEKHVSSMSHEQFPYQDSGANDMPSLHLPSQPPSRMIPQAHIPFQDPEDKRMPPFYSSSQDPARRIPPFYSPSYGPEGGRMPKFHPLSQDPTLKIPPFQSPNSRIPPSSTQFQTPAHQVLTDSGIPGDVSSQEESFNQNPLKALFNWKNIVTAVVDAVSKRTIKNGEIELLDHYCNYFTRPYFVKWRIQFLTDVWCPGWTTVVGSGLSTETSTSIQLAIRDFVMNSQAEGIAHPDDVNHWYKNNSNGYDSFTSEV